MKNNSTPLESIRKYCLWCCLDQPSEIKLCPSVDCVLYPFRMGKKTVKASLVKIIKKRCLDCGEGTAQAVKKCEFEDCPLFPFRTGKSPAHQLVWANRPHPSGFKKTGGPAVQKIPKN